MEDSAKFVRGHGDGDAWLEAAPSVNGAVLHADDARWYWLASSRRVAIVDLCGFSGSRTEPSVNQPP